MRRHRISTRTTLLAAACLAGSATFAGAATLVPGVEIAEDGTTVVAMAPAGGVVALAANSGEVRWSSAAGDRPLIVAGDSVLTQVERLDRGRLELAALALADGQPAGASTIAIDPSVRARLADGLGEQFSLTALTAAGQHFLTWDYAVRNVQGTAPADNAGDLDVLDGAFLVDLTTSSATAIDRASIPPVTTGQPPVGFLQALAADQLVVEPVVSGAIWAAVAARPGPAGATRLVLVRWDTADNSVLAEIVLWTGHALHVWPVLDESAAIVAASTHPGDWQEYTWSVFRLATGAAAGEARSPVARAPVGLIAGNLLLTVQPPAGRRTGAGWSELPRRLVALDLGSGDEVWTRAVRDLAFRGPFPP